MSFHASACAAATKPLKKLGVVCQPAPFSNTGRRYRGAYSIFYRSELLSKRSKGDVASEGKCASGGTGHKFCRFYKRGLLPSTPV